MSENQPKRSSRARTAATSRASSARVQETVPPAAAKHAPAQAKPRTRTAAAAVAGSLTKMAAALNTEVSQIAAQPAKRPIPKTRQNKKGLVLYVDADVTVALRRLALDTGLSVQQLGLRAINMLMAEHGKPAFPEDRA